VVVVIKDLVDIPDLVLLGITDLKDLLDIQDLLQQVVDSTVNSPIIVEEHVQ
jgi:hypothetical protein